MCKEPTFNRVVLAAVAREVSDSNRQPDRFTQPLKVVLEQMAVGGIAAAAITQQQDACRPGIALPANAAPVPTQTFHGKLTGVMAQSKVDVPDVSADVVNSVRDQFAVRPTREIMIESLQGGGAVDPSLAVQATKEFLGFGVHGKDRIAFTLVHVCQIADSFKLLPAIGRVSPRQCLFGFAAVPTRSRDTTS